MPRKHPDVECSEISDNETWNNCPVCGKNWKSVPPIQGILHRTRICQSCCDIYLDEQTLD